MLSDVTVLAPAKVNLGLKVLPKRDDGFHDIEGIFQSVDLCDELHLKRTENKNTCAVFCKEMDIPSVNTVTRTYEAVRRLLARDLDGVSVELTKKIPACGGLGGGSSDAASFLFGLQQLLGFRLTDSEMQSVAAEVGSDVFFFLACKCKPGVAAVVTGRGEIVKPIKPRKDLFFVLVFPGVESSTKEAYALIDEAFAKGDNIEYVAKDELEFVYNRPISKWNFVNSFLFVIGRNYAPIQQAVADLKMADAIFADMSGSGSTVFGVFDQLEKAEEALSILSKKWRAVLTV